MTKSSEITAIFKNNLYFLETKKFLVNEGYKINRHKNGNFFKKENLKESILIVEIDNEKNMEAIFSFLEKKHNKVYIICILKKNFKILISHKNLKILVQPFTFNELLRNISILEKNLYNMNSIKLIDLEYFPNHSEFLDKRNGKTIQLTDLENKLVLFLLKNINGCDKSEILRNVWEHKVNLDTHTMESLIYRLRRKIENDLNNPKILVQVKNKYFLKIN